jgi:ubiquinone/menaquinone biosynthesis C-methylase UbiE
MSNQPVWDAALCQRYTDGMRKLAPYDHRSVAARIARRLVGLSAGAYVVDLASGPGFLAFELARVITQPELTLVDSAEPMLQLATLEAEQQGLQVRTLVSAAERVALPDAVADVVVCKNLMNCIGPAHRLKVVDEVIRLVKPGGRAFVIDFDAQGSRIAAAAIGLLTRLLAGAEFSRDFRRAFARRLEPTPLSMAFEARGCAVEIERSGPTFLVVATKH